MESDYHLAFKSSNPLLLAQSFSLAIKPVPKMIEGQLCTDQDTSSCHQPLIFRVEM
jgi:hypothetical protein